jgi:hypothetical protein
VVRRLSLGVSSAFLVACGTTPKDAAPSFSFGDASDFGDAGDASHDGGSAVSLDQADAVGVSAVISGISLEYLNLEAESPPWPLAVDGALFWADGSNKAASSVMTSSLSGKGAVALVPAHLPEALAVDGSNVYWLDWAESESRVMQAPRDGGAPSTLATRTLVGHSIAVDSRNVYWSEGGSRQENPWQDNTTETNYVMRVPIGGGALATLASSADGVGGVVADSSGVYWAEYGETVTRIARDTVNGAPIETVATEPFSGVGVTLGLDETSVYWTTADGVAKAPKGGGQALTLASMRSPLGLAVDGTDVYWIDANDLVLRIPTGGGAVSTIAARGMASYPVAIALDSTSLYWLSMDLASPTLTYTIFTAHTASTSPGGPTK